MAENDKEEHMSIEKQAKVKEYYDWLATVYPIESFEIDSKNGEKMYFHCTYNSQQVDGDKMQMYFLLDKDYENVFLENKKRHLAGLEAEYNKAFDAKGWFSIDKEEKVFNFGIEWDYHNRGYGRAIYDNYLTILQMLGIEDREQYELRIFGNSEHDFLKQMATRKLVARTNHEPNSESAEQILKEFAQYPNAMRFSQLNTIIEYAINSHVPMEQIANSINKNGFNIVYGTINRDPKFEEADVNKFKSFGITGLKVTSMHEHFMKNKSFGFMQLLDVVDTQDATLEFKRVLDEVKKDYEERNQQGKNIYSSLAEYGELEYIILDWENFGLLVKNLNPEVQELVKKQAIKHFDLFDSEHNYSWYNYKIDYNSSRTIRMLKDAEMLDKDTYIALYQKGLNRNYDLHDFDSIVGRAFEYEERNKAKQEIEQNSYYPCPKGSWQRGLGENHRIPTIDVPNKLLRKKGSMQNIRSILKKEILEQGIAKKTKIKTDMQGITEDGRIIQVDNLKDWLFGVPGVFGNLKFTEGKILFPPQTPKFAVELVKEALRNIEYPDYGNR